MNDKWNDRFMELAQLVSTWSKDPSTRCGAVAVDPLSRNILSLGYNGFPRGIDDTEDRLNLRSTKYSLTVHAEMNAIYNAGKNGSSLKDAWLYVYGLPVCSDCSLGIIQAGINTIIIKQEFMENERWVKSWCQSRSNFIESGVNIKII